MDSVSVALRAVALQRWLSIAAMLSGVVVPLVAVWALRPWSARRQAWQASLIWVGGCFTSLLYCAAAYVFGVCWGGETGESGKNRLARAYGEPVVRALEAFHRDSATYPRTLRALVPTYLAPTALAAPESSVLHYPFEYRADSGRFELLVRYTGPGMNECRIGPNRTWRCGGYF